MIDERPHASMPPIPNSLRYGGEAGGWLGGDGLEEYDLEHGMYATRCASRIWASISPELPTMMAPGESGGRGGEANGGDTGGANGGDNGKGVTGGSGGGGGSGGTGGDGKRTPHVLHVTLQLALKPSPIICPHADIVQQ